MNIILPFDRLQAKYDVLEKLIGPFQEQLQAFESEKQILLGSKTNVEIEITKLSEEYARLLGHQNQKQKIKHVLKLKHENNTLKQVIMKTSLMGSTLIFTCITKKKL